MSDTAPRPAALRFEGVRKTYAAAGRAPVEALRGISLDVFVGETVCLIGPSGCGKTTTLRLVNRLETASAGRVFVHGRDVLDHDPIRLRRSIGYVVQSGGLFPHLTVAQNVGLLCELERWDPARTAARADELLELVHLDPREHGTRFPRELSGGQRQRVGVARALATDPGIVLMDEPFGALDPITRDQLQAEFVELAGRLAKTILLVTHNLREAFRLGDRVALLEDGRLAQVGTRATFEHEPASPFVERFVASHMEGAR